MRFFGSGQLLHHHPAAFGFHQPPGQSQGTAVAQFTVTSLGSSAYKLDATGSVGSLTWTIDGRVLSQNSIVLNIGPIKVATHSFQLDAITTDGHATTGINFETPWVGEPLDMAQHDNCNQQAGSGLTLPVWTPLPAIGPWRNKGVLNEAYSGWTNPPADGTLRVRKFNDGSMSLLTKYGDHPGTTGGYRSSMELNNAYTGQTSGFPLGVPYIDPVGGGGNTTYGNGQQSTVRFYRISILLPSVNWNNTPTPGSPTDTISPSGLLYQNNCFEIHGDIGGSSPVRIQTDGIGKNIQVAFITAIAGVDGTPQYFDTRPIQYVNPNIAGKPNHDPNLPTTWGYVDGQGNIHGWYNYVIEFRPDLRTNVGYIRVWRCPDLDSIGNVIDSTNPTNYVLTTRLPSSSGWPGTANAPGSSITLDGKYMTNTQQTDKNNVVVPLAFDCQNYRTRNGMPSNFPDMTIYYRNIRVGPTFASVFTY